MAIATAPAVFTQANVTVVGTSVAPGTVVPDNCHTILLLNRTANVALWAFGTAPNPLTDDGTSGVIAGLGSLTLNCGVKSERLTDWSTLIFDAVLNPTRVSITYLCGQNT